MPKAVINTQEMMCANVAMMSMARVRKASDAAPVMLDWLPWNHTMGGNATFQGNLNEGGTTYIDDGKPLPGLFEETLRNLHKIWHRPVNLFTVVNKKKVHLSFDGNEYKERNLT